MAAETAPIRDKTRRVKDHILTRYLKLADKVDAGEAEGKSIKTILMAEDFLLYREMTMIFSRNVIPRSHEVAGDPDNRTPVPILTTTMNVPSDDGDQENSQTSETD